MGAPAIKARLGSVSARIESLVRAIEESDEAKIEAAVLRLSEAGATGAVRAIKMSASLTGGRQPGAPATGS